MVARRLSMQHTHTLAIALLYCKLYHLQLRKSSIAQSPLPISYSGPSAHAIAALSAANGFALLAMFCIHFSQRRLIESHGRRVVAKPPTSIAGIGALVSERHRPPSGKPGFLDGLTPADTAEELELKLTSWEFSFAADGRIIGQRLQNAPA